MDHHEDSVTAQHITEQLKEIASRPEHAPLTDEDKQKLRQMSLVSMWLDGYDDMFSDFDSRQYSQRLLSEDFLAETKREVRDTATGKIELSFLIPAGKRNPYHESVIRKRLHDHFRKHHTLQHEHQRKLLRQGYSFILIGFLAMFLATYILFSFTEDSFLTHFLAIVFEPAGWFFFWEGLDMIIFESKEKKPELEFYEKMHNCSISFSSY